MKDTNIQIFGYLRETEKAWLVEVEVVMERVEVWLPKSLTQILSGGELPHIATVPWWLWDAKVREWRASQGLGGARLSEQMSTRQRDVHLAPLGVRAEEAPANLHARKWRLGG